MIEKKGSTLNGDIRKSKTVLRLSKKRTEEAKR
jgi:hypothetical protein